MLSAADGRKVENDKQNGHANGSVGATAANCQPETDVEPDLDGTKQAFLSLEEVEEGRAKASVMQVFRKVNPGWMCRMAAMMKTSVTSGINSPTSRNVSFVCFQIWVMAFSVTFVFTVTLSVFPAVTVDVKTLFPGRWGTMKPLLRSCVGGCVVTPFSPAPPPQSASLFQCVAF